MELARARITSHRHEHHGLCYRWSACWLASAIAGDLVVQLSDTEHANRCAQAARACNFNKLAIAQHLFATAFATEKDRKGNNLGFLFCFLFYFFFETGSGTYGTPPAGEEEATGRCLLCLFYTALAYSFTRKANKSPQ